jgi:DNA-binding XRE family transcriptional regulator
MQAEISFALKFFLHILWHNQQRRLMAKLKTHTIREADTKVFAKLEARRRFLGAKQSDIAELIGIHHRTYMYWIKIGTTQKNADRIKTALLAFSERGGNNEKV